MDEVRWQGVARFTGGLTPRRFLWWDSGMCRR